MKKFFTVLAIALVVFSVILSGCQRANNVPGVTAVKSAVASALPAVTYTPIATATYSPIASATYSPIASAARSPIVTGTTIKPSTTISPLATR